MANNTYIVNSARFQPFTYDELVKPLNRLEEKHDKMLDLYDKYSEANDILGQEIDPNSETYKIYQQNKDNINKGVDILMKNGVTDPSSMNIFRSIRKSVSENNAILNARVKRYNEKLDELKKASANGMIASYNTPDIDDMDNTPYKIYTDNEGNELKVNKNLYVNQKELLSEAALMNSSILASLGTNTEYKYLYDELKTRYAQQIQSNGGVPLQDFNSFVQGNIDNDSRYFPLRQALDLAEQQLRDKYNYNEFDEYGKKQIDSVLKQSEYGVLQNTETKTIDSKTAIERAMESLQLKAAQKKLDDSDNSSSGFNLDGLGGLKNTGYVHYYRMNEDGTHPTIYKTKDGTPIFMYGDYVVPMTNEQYTKAQLINKDYVPVLSNDVAGEGMYFVKKKDEAVLNGMLQNQNRVIVNNSKGVELYRMDKYGKLYKVTENVSNEVLNYWKKNKKYNHVSDKKIQLSTPEQYDVVNEPTNASNTVVESTPISIQAQTTTTPTQSNKNTATTKTTTKQQSGSQSKTNKNQKPSVVDIYPEGDDDSRLF